MRKSLIIALSLSILIMSNAFGYSRERLGRLGVGFTNQLKVDAPALSVKVLKTSTFALGAALAYDSDDDGGMGLGVKLYRLIFDEPNLNFYSSLLLAYLNDSTDGSDQTGFQSDMTLGTEFSFQGLESIGFSFEFGVSINKLEEVRIQTTGNHFVTAGVHFYL